MTRWTRRKLEHAGIEVGPCAWRLPMLAGADRDYVKAHPSLIVVDPSDDDGLLEQAGPHTVGLPVLLGIAEPAFARQLEHAVMQRLNLLGRDTIDALVLHVQDPAEIKSGGMLQTMFALRERGVVGRLGLAHPNPNVAEWLSMNAAVRLLGVGYSLDDPSARHRALPSAAEYGMSAFALSCPGDDQAVRFALAEAGRILPVMDRPIPTGLTPMPPHETDRLWDRFQKSHPPPPPLERGRPPTPPGD
jgi:hypothetical protein